MCVGQGDEKIMLGFYQQLPEDEDGDQGYTLSQSYVVRALMDYLAAPSLLNSPDEMTRLGVRPE